MYGRRCAQLYATRAPFDEIVNVFKRIQDWLSNAESNSTEANDGATIEPSLQPLLVDTMLSEVDVQALMPLLDNSIQARFLPGRELGRGSTSSVHDAEDVRLARNTALKVIAYESSLASTGAPAVRR